jgi:hypothetical protein
MDAPIAFVSLFLDKFKRSNAHVDAASASHIDFVHASSTPHPEKFNARTRFTASAHVAPIARETLFSLKFNALRRFARVAARHNADTPSSSI